MVALTITIAASCATVCTASVCRSFSRMAGSLPRAPLSADDVAPFVRRGQRLDALAERGLIVGRLPALLRAHARRTEQHESEGAGSNKIPHVCLLVGSPVYKWPYFQTVPATPSPGSGVFAGGGIGKSRRTAYI